MRAIDRYDALLFDVQLTLAFGGDRFGEHEDYFTTYAALGGSGLSPHAVNRAVRACVDHLWPLYNDTSHYDDFPGLAQGFAAACPDLRLDETQLRLLERTLAEHERGFVPQGHARALHALAATHRLGVVSNIWAHKQTWLDDFQAKGVLHLFEVLVFSSDTRSIKPSPLLFQEALRLLELDASRVLFVGDSMERDMAPAKALGMGAALVLNGNDPPEASDPRPDYLLASVPDLVHLAG